ncbi:MAG TPA: hypothetical protein VK510_17540 [Solirubrobacteraceae bacterium]|jgi:hypothetical protein|nr:hypothetical protein [Solirubrobacteraceae bacterium]
MGPHAPHDFSDPLGREIERSRRYRHAFTLIRVAPEKAFDTQVRVPRSRRVGRPGRRHHGPLDELAAALRACVRTGDVAWSEGAALYVLLPETDATGANAVVERFRRTARAVAGDADVRAASFPEQGLTDHALRAAVTRRPLPASAFTRNGAASSNVGRGSFATEAFD